jgi:hypothetical protein
LLELCVDAARAIIPNAAELSGAALRSALTKAIGERPSLSPGFSERMAALPNGLDGGAGRGRSVETMTVSERMSDALKAAAGRPPGTYGED